MNAESEIAPPSPWHTNAQLWIRYGAEGAVLSEMMGQTKQETTKNSFDVNIPEIVEVPKE